MTNTTRPDIRHSAPTDSLSTAKVVVAWLFVGIPLAWAVWQVFVKALVLFREGT